MSAPDFFEFAIAFVLKNEISGKVTAYHDAKTGEYSNYGISLGWLKGVQPGASKGTIDALTLETAKALYRKYWWSEIGLAGIPDARIAAKVMDICVNMGARSGIKLLQISINNLLLVGKTELLEPDGVMGPKTVDGLKEALESCQGRPDLILKQLQELTKARYRVIAASNPAGHAADLKGWLTRAGKLPGTLPDEAPETVNA